MLGVQSDFGFLGDSIRTTLRSSPLKLEVKLVSLPLFLECLAAVPSPTVSRVPLIKGHAEYKWPTP